MRCHQLIVWLSTELGIKPIAIKYHRNLLFTNFAVYIVDCSCLQIIGIKAYNLMLLHGWYAFFSSSSRKASNLLKGTPALSKSCDNLQSIDTHFFRKPLPYKCIDLSKVTHVLAYPQFFFLFSPYESFHSHAVNT